MVRLLIDPREEVTAERKLSIRVGCGGGREAEGTAGGHSGAKGRDGAGWAREPAAEVEAGHAGAKDRDWAGEAYVVKAGAGGNAAAFAVGRAEEEDETAKKALADAGDSEGGGVGGGGVGGGA